ncbi:MAG: hypothetical protein GF383_10095, partial [Candidatus Lokiarchaeota archaeon]|nr:hypothetical protein [Candidatus Lokiarchaeota archaeon]
MSFIDFPKAHSKATASQSISLIDYKDFMGIIKTLNEKKPIVLDSDLSTLYHSIRATGT